MRLFATVTVILFAGAVWLTAGASDPPVLATEVRVSAAALLAPDESSGAPPAQAVASLVAALSRLAREAALPESFRSKLDLAAARVRDERFPDDRALEELRSAYAALNGGRPFEFPAGVRSLEAAREFGRRQVDRGVAALTAARNEEAAREILGFVLLVATPMEASF